MIAGGTRGSVLQYRVAILSSVKNTLKKTSEDIGPVSDLTEAEVDALFQNPAFRRMVDARLAESEALGGETPQDVVFAELRKRHGL